MRRVLCARAVGRIKCRTIANIPNARIVERKWLRHAENERRTGFQRTCIGFVAGTMLKENAVATADRGLTIAHWIPRKTHTRRGIEKMPFHASRRGTIYPALNQAEIAYYPGIQLKRARVEGHRRRGRVLVQEHAAERIHAKSRGIEFGRFPVPGIVIFLAVSAKQADSQAYVQRKSRSYLPVVLKIRLTDLVSLVVPTLRRILGKALYVSGGNSVKHCLSQKISEGISCAVRQVAESQQPLQITRSSADCVVFLIALR